MALQKTSIAVRLGQGVETKADAKTVPTTKLLALENGVFTRGLTIAKRHGYTALPRTVLGQADPYGAPKGLAARDPELVLFADDRAYTFLPGPETWKKGEIVQSVMQSDRPLLKSASAQVRGDYAATGGIGLTAWEDSRGYLYFAVIADDEAGQVIQGPTAISGTGTRPRCIVCGGKLILLWAEADEGQVKCLLIDPTIPDAYDKGQFPRVLIDDLVTTVPNYDAATVPVTADTAAAAAIAWNSVDGIRVGWLTQAARLGSPATGLPSPGTIEDTAGIGIVCGPVIAVPAWEQTTWGLTWATATHGYAAVVDAESVTVDNAPREFAIADVTNCANAWRAVSPRDQLDSWFEQRADPVRNSVVTRKVIDTISDEKAPDYSITRGVALASKGWSDPADGDAALSASYVTLVHDVPLFAVYMTMRHDGFCVARTLPGLAGHAVPENTPHLPSVIASADDGARAYRWTAVYRTQLEAVNLDQFTEDGLRLVSLDFADASAFQSIVSGRTLYLGAACPLLYDGQGWFEHQPHYAADWEADEVLHVNDEGTGPSAGDLTAGTRAYVFTYDYTLATGELVRGPTSKPYDVTIVGPDNTTILTIPTLRVTRMSSLVPSPSGRADAVISVWRTIAGDASVYYRVSGQPFVPGAGGGSGNVVPGYQNVNVAIANSTIVDFITFTDQLSDDDLIKQEPLYTNGGILSNDPPAETGVIAGGKNRLFATDPADGSTVRYSQERADGYAVEWPADLSMQLDPFGGDVTAIGILDDSVVMFKAASIYEVSGPGPLANPDAGGGWSAPALITSDVGCLSQRSLATTPMGLVFQTAKGIHLLDRSHQVTYIGAPVEAYNDQTIVRATLIDGTTQIRFLTAEGSTLLWDYFFDQWSTFGNHEGLDAVTVGGVYHYLRTDGRVFVEQATPSDAGSAVVLDMETAWIHLQEQLQGFQHIYHLEVLGNWKSPHTLRMQYQTDYMDGWSEPLPFDATDPGGTGYGAGAYGDGPYGGVSRPAYQWRWHIGAKCQAIRFRFRDHEAYGVAGAAFEITELLITGGVKGPMYKLPAARSA